MVGAFRLLVRLLAPAVPRVLIVDDAGASVLAAQAFVLIRRQGIRDGYRWPSFPLPDGWRAAWAQVVIGREVPSAASRRVRAPLTVPL